MEENIDVTKLKVTELKKLLKERSLPVTGTKNQLLERLQGHLQGKVLETEDTGSTEVTDESQENIETDLLGGDDTFSLDDSQNKTEKPTEIIEAVHETANTGVVINKIVFNTEVSQEEVLKKRAEKFGLNSDEEKKDSRAQKFGLNNDEEKKESRAEKFGLNSDQNKKDARAQKFGLNSDEDKKDSRAKRFGTIVAPSDHDNSTKKDTTALSKPITAPVQNKNEQVDKLKKRAERFGMIVSNTLTEIDSTERRQKRKERFGEILVSSTKSNVSDDERIKKRKERFGSTDKKNERANRFGLT